MTTAEIPEPPAWYDDLEQLDEQTKFNEAVAKKTRELRILDAARARIVAEKEADIDFSDLYFDRNQLDDLPKHESLIRGVLPRHSYGILRGRDHTLKSFVAIDWACSLATGKPWQGRRVDPVPVLYIAGEGAHGISKRINAWEYAWGETVPPDMLTIRRLALNLYQPGPALTELLRRVETARYGLVIVDTLRRVSGAADGNGSEMGVVIDNLALIKDATDNGTVLAVAHTDKSDTDTRGYSGIEDDADFVWHTKRTDMRLDLELTKMKDGPDGLRVQLHAGTVLDSLVLTSITGAPEPSTTESQLKILDTMRDQFPDGAHGGQLKDATGLPNSTYYRALKDLKDAGHLVNNGTKQRPFFELPALALETSESQLLPDAKTPADLQESHDSHDSQPVLPSLSPTPTPLKGGSESGSGTNTNQETE